MASSKQWTEHTITYPNGKTRYIACGPLYGPLLIFVHGWIGCAETWKHQLLAFSALGFRCVAPDTRGYGGSANPQDPKEYALEKIVYDMRELLKHLGPEKAVWIGHDWGAGIVNCVAGHHPEICVGVVSIAVPYSTVEYGIQHLIGLVNREIYPESEYPAGQWDYMLFHNEDAKRSAATLDANPEGTAKFLMSSMGMKGYKKPSPTSQLRKQGGWFREADRAPDRPISKTLLAKDPDIHEKLVATIRDNGTTGPNAYYLNFETNIEWHKKNVPNDGMLAVPYLYIDPKYDAICDASLSRLAEPMRKRCLHLTEVSIESEHWVQLERPTEVNAALAKWIATQIPEYWPGVWRTPLVTKSKL